MGVDAGQRCRSRDALGVGGASGGAAAEEEVCRRWRRGKGVGGVKGSGAWCDVVCSVSSTPSLETFMMSCLVRVVVVVAAAVLGYPVPTLFRT